MAAKPKLALTQSTSIPLDRLVPSDANVRKTNAAISIDELAASIARRGLLQSLSVRPVLNGEGNATGDYEVQAGSRRMRALKLLAKQKRLAKDAPIPCIVKTTGIAEDDSLAENSDREALHPLDQFRAFAALTEKGQSEEDIAAAFAVTPAVVRQRLKLASASPKLLDAYATDQLNLEQLMAFCVTGDHARQEQVLETILQQQISDDPYTIRRLLTETCVEASDPRARFVGIETYIAAGGSIMRDLFEEDDGGWLQDPDILMRLVSEKLAAAKERILAQGWKWAEAALDHRYNFKLGLRRLRPIADALTEPDEKRYLALSEEHDGLIEALDDEDEIPADVRARLDAIEATLAEFDNRPPKFAPEDIACGGVLLSVGHNGQLNVEYGFIRPEDAASAGAAEADSQEGDDAAPYDEENHGRTQPSADHDDGEQPDGAKQLPDRLVQDLTAYRTVALRDALANDFDTALLAVLHAMCLKLFYGSRYNLLSCLQIDPIPHFPAGAPRLADTPAAKAIEQRHQHWQTKLPEDPRLLWEALAAFNRHADLPALFAHCASLTLNAVCEPHHRRGEARRRADNLATALSLDMTAAAWVTGADNYLGRVTKAQILEAVREARGDDTARLIEHLKKGDMAKEAERLLQGTGWLPEPLRTPQAGSPSPSGDSSEASPLPAFLTEDPGIGREAERAAAE
jgi:ParB family chromosome partitioning protein